MFEKAIIKLIKKFIVKLENKERRSKKEMSRGSE
jgi:hypothetical protein